MSFHFVDRICELESGKSARGIKNVTRNESFFYWLPTGKRVLSPAVITEALAQLGAWLKMYTVDFTKRPVLLADELTSYHGWVEAGDRLDLHVKVLEFDDDVVVTQSYAEVDGRKVSYTRTCRGYMLPVEEFDEREAVIRHFNAIYKPGHPVATAIDAKHSMGAIAGRKSFDALRFLDGLVEHVPYEKVVGFKNFSICEPYFADHFPYKPVVPGVLLMTFMGEVCQFLIKEKIDAPLRARALIPTYVQNLRFRKFVEPGDQCVMTAEIKEGNCRNDGEDILVAASMYANNKRVMTGEMGFRVMKGISSIALDRDFPIALT